MPCAPWKAVARETSTWVKGEAWGNWSVYWSTPLYQESTTSAPVGQTEEEGREGGGARSKRTGWFWVDVAIGHKLPNTQSHQWHTSYKYLKKTRK